MPFSRHPHRVTHRNGPWRVAPRLEQTSLPSSIPVCAPRPPRVALRLPSGAPPTGLGVSPRTDVRGPSGTPTVGARRYWWPLVASAVGICGLLTVGYPSIADSGGYGRCGFRLMGVPRRSASSWSSMCQPRSAPRGAPRVPVADLALGNSVGAIGMAPGALPVRWRRPRRVGCVSHPFHDIPAPPLSGVAAGPPRGPALGSYLVDSASSHMLVSKIKPCMSKYKHSFTVKLRMAH